MKALHKPGVGGRRGTAVLKESTAELSLYFISLSSHGASQRSCDTKYFSDGVGSLIGYQAATSGPRQEMTPFLLETGGIWGVL